MPSSLPAVSEPTHTFAAQSWRRMVGTRILVVDDEQNITDLVATALRYEGFDVATAATARGALELVGSFRPELLVLDVMLPDLDGFQLHGRLTAARMGLPVLYLSARDATEDKVRGLTL